MAARSAGPARCNTGEPAAAQGTTAGANQAGPPETAATTTEATSAATTSRTTGTTARYG